MDLTILRTKIDVHVMYFNFVIYGTHKGVNYLIS